MAKVTSINKAKAEDTLAREESIAKGLKIIGTVALGAGMYGFQLGRKVGYAKGVKEGYVVAINELVGAWEQHTLALVQSARDKERE